MSIKKLPRILVVDDQFGRDPPDEECVKFLKSLSLVKRGADGRGTSDIGEVQTPIAEVELCSGQVVIGARLSNQAHLVVRAVEQHESNGERLALVLLDATFTSGKMDNGIPSGQAGDEIFGDEVRRALAEKYPDLPVMMLTAIFHVNLPHAEEVRNYFYKWCRDPRRLKHKLLQLSSNRLTPEQIRNLLELDPDTVAVAPNTVEAYRLAFIDANHDSSVLILGETGVGKGELARYILRRSNRVGKRFVTVNCATIAETLVESELFGHVRGAFTGAYQDRKGRFQQADGGTIFLDEIGELSPAMQSKLLLVLDDGNVTTVGGSTMTVDVRVIAATNRDLKAMVKEGKFREDLFERLKDSIITIPPLRDRREDIVPLAKFFLHKAGKEGVSFSDDAEKALKTSQNPFPGNVRYLEKLVGRMVRNAGPFEQLGKRIVDNALRIELELEPPVPDEETVLGTLPPTLPSPKKDKFALIDLLELMEKYSVNEYDPDLKGIKPRFDKTVLRLLQRIAGKAVIRCLDPITGKPERTSAMQYLMGDGDKPIKNKEPGNMVNEIMGFQTTANQNLKEQGKYLDYLVRVSKGGPYEGKAA